jgi:DnaJ-class molecular chaperone
MATATKDYYEVLGVSRDATQKDIGRAFRKLAKKHHPDANRGDTKAAHRFKEVNEAHQVLKDPEKRKQYDSPEPDWQSVFGRNGNSAGHFESRNSVNSEELKDLFGGIGGTGGRGARVFDLGDLLGGMAGKRQSWSSAQGDFEFAGSDVEAELPLSLHEAHHGGTRSLSVGGKGVEVNVPRGVRNGSVIRLAGQGEPGANGGKPGDLLLRVRLLPDPRFKVTGHDLETEAKLAPWEAVLGAEIAVPTLDGSVHLTIPAGTQSGRRLRLRGQGLGKRDGSRGDLYARVTVAVPTNPTPEEKRLFEELSRASKFDPRAT